MAMRYKINYIQNTHNYIFIGHQVRYDYDDGSDEVSIALS